MANNGYSQLERNETLWKHRKITLSSTTTTVKHNNNDTQCKKKSFMIENSIYAEIIILFKLSLQLSITFIIDGCTAFVGRAFIGHLPNSSTILSASSIASCFMYTFLIFPSWGFSTALLILIPQFVGNNQTHLITVSIQRAFVICFIVQIPLFISLYYSKHILNLIGIYDIDWDIFTNCSYALIPYPFAFWTLSILQRLAQCLNLSFEIAVITVLNFIASIALNYMFIHTFQFGYIGAIICHILTAFIGIILMVSLLIYKGYAFIFKPVAFKNVFDKNGIFEYLRLAIPGCIQLNLSLFPATFTPLLCGSLDNAKFSVSAVSIMHALNQLIWFHVGVAHSSGIRIGKYIGANSICYAKRCIKIQIFYELSVIIFVSVIYTIFKYDMPKLFTNESDISSFISNKLIYLLLFSQINNGICRNVSAIHTALGYPKTNVYVCFTTKYIIAYPLCLYLLFSNAYHYYDNMEMGIYVIYMCDTFGNLLAHICLIFILICYVDWNKALKDSNFRIKVNNTNQLADCVQASINSKTNNNNGKISRSL